MMDLALDEVARAPARPATDAGMQALTFELRPHRSLTDAGARLFLASVALVNLSAAVLIALRGAWPVLLFAMIVILGVRAALRVNMTARNDHQEIHVYEHEVQLRFTERSRTSVVNLKRHWTRARLQRSHLLGHPSALLVESAGRSYEIGSFLTEPARLDLQAQLCRVIGRIGELPPLPQRCS
jgi:uncharacterized membrane protein